MAYNWAARRATATRMITKYGSRALLRSTAGGDRACVVCEDNQMPRSQPGSLRNSPDRIYLIVADGLNPPPDPEKEHLVLLDPETGLEVESVRMVAPMGRVAPGRYVLYWEAQVRQ